MKPLIKPKDHMRKKRHRKTGEMSESVLDKLEKKARKKKRKLKIDN